MNNQINELQTECLKRRIRRYIDSKVSDIMMLERNIIREEMNEADEKRLKIYTELGTIKYTWWEKFLISTKFKKPVDTTDMVLELDNLATVIRRCKLDIYTYQTPDFNITGVIEDEIDNIILDGYSQPLFKHLKRFEEMVDDAITEYKKEKWPDSSHGEAQ